MNISGINIKKTGVCQNLGKQITPSSGSAKKIGVYEWKKLLKGAFSAQRSR